MGFKDRSGENWHINILGLSSYEHGLFPLTQELISLIRGKFLTWVFPLFIFLSSLVS